MKVLTKIAHAMFLSCLKATEIIEKKLSFGINFKEKLQLKVHQSMCKACVLYENQSVFLEKSIAKNLKEVETTEDLSELKELIISKINTQESN